MASESRAIRTESRILHALRDGEWHAEPELRSSFKTLQDMYLRGLIDGAMQSFGGSASDRVWRITPAAAPPKQQSGRKVSPTAADGERG